MVINTWFYISGGPILTNLLPGQKGGPTPLAHSVFPRQREGRVCFHVKGVQIFFTFVYLGIDSSRVLLNARICVAGFVPPYLPPAGYIQCLLDSGTPLFKCMYSVYFFLIRVCVLLSNSGLVSA